MKEKRMGGMSLGNFSGIKKSKSEAAKQPEPEATESEVKQTESKPVKTAESEAKVVTGDTRTRGDLASRALKKTKTKQKKEQLVTVNIKIRKSQKEWLTNTASTVRDNNTEPVPPSERVYPQHLIGVALDLLQNVDVDWNKVKNVEELREHFNL
ncbi:hypothetical protein NIES4102_43330 (plasmid) [Chondrocystis sp. NIES-4102]|nr:hypothetical protein NIES4102_43330 [Chondrocystis sp. NIES-4102]